VSEDGNRMGMRGDDVAGYVAGSRQFDRIPLRFKTIFQVTQCCSSCRSLLHLGYVIRHPFPSMLCAAVSG